MKDKKGLKKENWLSSTLMLTAVLLGVLQSPSKFIHAFLEYKEC